MPGDSAAKKRLHIVDAARARQRRQRIEEDPAVALAEQARIAQHQHAAIALAADQAAGALLERDHRLRQLLVAEGIAAGAAHRIQPRLEHRIVRRRERQLVDHHHAQRFAGDIDAFAETRRPQQHAVAGFAETLQQHVAGRVALHEQRPRPAAQGLGGFAQRAMRGEQHEGAPGRGFEHGPQRIDQCVVVVARHRLGQRRRQVAQRLRVPVEWTGLQQRASARSGPRRVAT